MQLRLRTKLTLVMTGLVLLVVAAVSGVYFALLLQQVLDQSERRAAEIASNTFDLVNVALQEAKALGWRPESNAPEDIRDYVAYALSASQGLQAQLQAAIASPGIYEVSITDHEGRVLASAPDKSLVNRFALGRPPLSQLTQRGILNQVKVLAGPPSIYEHQFQFNYGEEPFGEVRVEISSGLLLNKEILPIVRKLGTIVLLALVISTVLAAGQYDAPVPEVRGFAGSSDELGQVSRKITQVGQQLRGVHEIFSTMRENMNSVMAGMEDGLLLFTREARAVMVSPAAEKFLGAPAGAFLGRRVNEIFPAGHPLHDVLQVQGDELSEIAAETDLQTIEGPRRVSVSVQAIQEDGERMGALVTLRDLDSIESINTQLQVSERLAALGRITAGVAHEVKNPLNSMRLWLENLKESLPAE